MRRTTDSLRLRLAIFLCIQLVFVSIGIAQTANLTIESGSGKIGETIPLNVNISNVDGLNVIAAQFTINFNKDILVATNATLNGTIASGWSLSQRSLNGQLLISLAGATPLAGGGKLVVIEFTVKNSAQAGESTPLTFTNIAINEGSVVGKGASGTFSVVGTNPPPSGVELAVGNGSAIVGGSGDVLISIANISAQNIIAADFEIDFDSSVLDVENVTTTGTIASGWQASHNIINSTLCISMAGSSPISSDGDLLRITFTVKSGAAPGLSIPLNVKNISLNEGSISVTGKSGTFTIQGGDSSDKVKISVPQNSVGAAGGTIEIPVDMTNGTGKDIISISFFLEYDASILTTTQVSVSDGIISDWSLISRIESGKTLIAAAGANQISSDGKIVTVTLTISNLVSSGSESTVNITNVVLNEGGVPYEVENGIIRINQKSKIQGRVNYHNNGNAVPDVDLLLSGAETRSTKTDHSGAFEIKDLESGSYVLTPSKIGGFEKSITPFDASLVLRNYVGLLTLSDHSKLAADVSGDGNISAYDAALILRYSVGSISSFPIGEKWIFDPLQQIYSSYNADVSDADFISVVPGDVSGNWSSSQNLFKQCAGLVEVNMADTVLTRTDSLAWAVKISGINDTDIYSAGLELYYNRDHLQLVNVSNRNATTASWGSPIYNITENDVKIALAGTSPLETDGVLFILEFKVLAEVGQNSIVQLRNIILNEGEPPVADQASSLYINISPAPFDLIGPSNGSTLIDQPTTLSWEIADDTPDDEVTYTVLLAKNLYDLEKDTLTQTQNTSFETDVLIPKQTYYWRVIATDSYCASTKSSSIFSFKSSTDVASTTENGLPTEFKLYENFPNPFNPRTTIKYDLPQKTYIKLAVQNLLGQSIKTLVDEAQLPGKYSIFWDGTNEQGVSVTSGVYLCIIIADKYKSTKKLMLIR